MVVELQCSLPALRGHNRKILISTETKKAVFLHDSLFLFNKFPAFFFFGQQAFLCGKFHSVFCYFIIHFVTKKGGKKIQCS